MHAPDGKKRKYSFQERATMRERITGKDRGGSGSDRSPTSPKMPTMVESHTSCLRDDGHASELAIIYLSTLYN